jgi:hypothetical protein
MAENIRARIGQSGSLKVQVGQESSIKVVSALSVQGLQGTQGLAG